MWFLFMITGLYMLVPFLKKIAESGQLTKYFLLVGFFFAFLFPETVRIISLFSEPYGEFALKVLNNFHLKFTSEFTCYFLLGCLLNKSRLQTKTELMIYAAGIAGFAATVLMSLYASRFRSEGFDFYGSSTVNVMLEAVAVFVFFRQRLNFPSRLIRTLSQYSFGAYLVHALIIETLKYLGLNTLTFSPVISVPAISLLVFVISFAVSAVLNHVPVLRRYIV